MGYEVAHLFRDRVGFEGVLGHDSEVVATPFEGREEI
jgi:hypothetical protein